MVLHATSRGTSKASYGLGESGKLLFVEMGDFAVAYGTDVPAGDQELHDFRAFAGEFGPARGGCGILLESANSLAGEVEIDLGKLVFCGVLHPVRIIAEGDAFFAFEQRLAPDGEESVV
jgi:hypothetical protein